VKNRKNSLLKRLAEVQSEPNINGIGFERIGTVLEKTMLNAMG